MVEKKGRGNNKNVEGNRRDQKIDEILGELKIIDNFMSHMDLTNIVENISPVEVVKVIATPENMKALGEGFAKGLKS